MKITAVKTAATRGHGMHLWVRVETDEGIIGTGECVHGGVQAIALIHELRSKLIGRDPFEIDAIFEDLRRRHVFDGGFAGTLITALTGIEIALWDLKGKALNAPIYDLMGGKFRDKIRVYADCQVEPSMEFDEIKQVVEVVAERGFTALKIDVDIGAYTGDYRRSGGVQKDRFNYTADPWEHERMLKIVQYGAGEGDYDAVLWMELWARALRDPELAATRAELDGRWRRSIADVVRYGQERGEFGPADPDEFAVLLASLLDGLAVQIALRDMEVTPDRVRELAVKLAERELGCELVEGTRC